MKSKVKKFIAPILISVIMILYYVLYFGFLIWLIPAPWNYLIGIVPIAFVILTIKVCVERINEIKKGEEDDLSKY